ncbi:MAG: NotI family restriction endonuclease [Minwuia sp.]|uniref:NotI family restriction endonuclease n=1 Tax=Minwuia sp. TaxID=2493630 RepID=UPI003A8A36DA
MAKRQIRKVSYGIAELYGERFNAISNDRRIELLDSKSPPDCPHLVSFPRLAPIDQKSKLPKTQCSKKGGVCSLRSYIDGSDGQKFGDITTTCPKRFYQDGRVFKRIGGLLFDNEDALIINEVPFLKRNDGSGSEAEDTGTKTVGKIDMVMVDDSTGRLDWCAVELQAVYFSGAEMSKDYSVIRKHSGNGVPQPGGNRRPDFRSSGPKRLMPQLQTKVPTLRRWGKKMVVVVDRPFFDALGAMDAVPHISNCDIIWFIVRYEETDGAFGAELVVDDIRFTTLERAVEGLTAGTPTTLPEFEEGIIKKLGIAD